MTEEEAKTKWCPFYRVPTAWEDDGRREAREIGEQSCIASECMAWRKDWVGIGGPLTDGGHCGMVGK